MRWPGGPQGPRRAPRPWPATCSGGSAAPASRHIPSGLASPSRQSRQSDRVPPVVRVAPVPPSRRGALGLASSPLPGAPAPAPGASLARPEEAVPPLQHATQAAGPPKRQAARAPVPPPQQMAAAVVPPSRSIDVAAAPRPHAHEGRRPPGSRRRRKHRLRSAHRISRLLWYVLGHSADTCAHPGGGRSARTSALRGCSASHIADRSDRVP